MQRQNDRYWVETSLMFFGRVNASLSHEINNVFSIVNELAGLIDDHLLRIENDMPIDPVKLKEVTGKIAKQVKRGEALVKLLNRMAHSADNLTASIDLGELVERVVAVCQRFASLKKVVLDSRPPQERFMITTNPFLLQQALFHAIQMCLSAAEAKRSLTVGFEPGPSGGACIRITSADPVRDTDESASEKALLARCIEELEGSIEFEPGNDAIESVIMHIPPVQAG